MVYFDRPSNAQDALSLIRNRLLSLDSFSLYSACITSIDAFPDNPYVSFAACEQLLQTSHPDLALRIFCDRYFLLRTLDKHHRLRQLIQKLQYSISSSAYFFSVIFDLNLIYADSLLTQKISQDFFNQGRYSDVIDCLLSIKDNNTLSYHSVLILAQSSLSSCHPYLFRSILYLDSLYLSSGRFDVLASILLICFTTDERFLASTYWRQINLRFIDNWQMMLWFNRLIPPPQLEKIVVDILKSKSLPLETLSSSNLSFQYLITLLRHSELSLCRQMLSQLPDSFFSNSHIRCLSAGVNLNVFDDVVPSWSDRSKPLQESFRNSQYPVLVFFSGLTGALGHYPFHLLCALFSQQSVNIVVLQDPSQLFFSKGLSGFGSSLKESSQLLLTYLRQKFSSAIIYVGDSLSGLSALNFALISPPTAVLSLAGVLSVSDYSDNGHKFSSDTSSDLFVNPSSYGGYVEPLVQGHYAIIRAEKVRKLFPPINSLLNQSSLSFQLHYAYCSSNRSDQFTCSILNTYFQLYEHRIDNSSTHFVANLSIACTFYRDLFSNVMSSACGDAQPNYFYSYQGCEPQDLV